MATPSTVDVVGVVHYCAPSKERQLKSGQIKHVRQVQLADDTNRIIQLTIWGDYAQKFEIANDEHPVVAIKRVQVAEYMGRTLNSNEDSQFIINPPHTRTS